MNNISVIIPAYCVEKQIERCVFSVLAQSYANIQILLIDDGSPDKTGEICDQFAQQDSRVVVIHQQNAGVSKARNHSIQCVTGEYLMLLDGDDALDAECIETCIRESENGKWDAVVFGFHQYLETDRIIELKSDIGYKKSEAPNRSVLREKFLDYCKSGVLDFMTDKMIRTSAIRQNDIRFDSSFNIGGEDALFMMELFPHLTSMKITEHVFYQYYRRSGASITLTFHPNKFQKYYERILCLYRLMCQLNMIDEEYVVKQYGNYFLWSYESMFSANCRLRGMARFAFIRKNYRLKTIFPEQKRIVKTVLKGKENFSEYCLSSRIALRFFYKRHVFLLWGWQTVTMLIGRRKNKK